MVVTAVYAVVQLQHWPYCQDSPYVVNGRKLDTFGGSRMLINHRFQESLCELGGRDGRRVSMPTTHILISWVGSSVRAGFVSVGLDPRYVRDLELLG